MNRAVRIHIKTRSHRIRYQAEQGIWDGKSPTGTYFDSCRHIDAVTGAIILYTRDLGYHGCGWWKNPDYDRCYHLSLSFRDPMTGYPAPFDKKMAALWCENILRDMARFAWHESPQTKEGKQLAVHHWRVFCDPSWRPILPKGEVYSRTNTPAGYKTTSEQAEALKP